MNIKNENGLVHFLDHLTIRIIPSCIVIAIMLLAVIILGIILIVKWSKK